jgi:hypothetical protein
VLSGDKLAFEVGGGQEAYDVLSDPGFTLPIDVHCNQVFPANMVADAGTPD